MDRLHGAMEAGDFGMRLSFSGSALMGEIADAYNGIANRSDQMVRELVRVEPPVPAWVRAAGSPGWRRRWVPTVPAPPACLAGHRF